jgi:uncharacterized coiled-coil DUF342 family protein
MAKRKSKLPTGEKARDEFWRLNARCRAIKAQVQPVLDELDKGNAIIAKARAKQDEFVAKRRAIEADYAELSRERSQYVKLLGGKTGAAPEGFDDMIEAERQDMFGK